MEAFQVFDIEPAGSHGPAFVFFSDDGRAVMLIGQWLLDVPSFPSLSFCVSRWADTGSPIGVERSGVPVSPERSTARVPNGVRDVEIFEATPGGLVADLERQFGPVRSRKAPM